MKKSLKIIVLFVVVLVLTIVLSNVAFAAWNPGKAIKDAENWNSTGNVVNSTKTIMGTAINVIRIVGTGIAIIMITYIAIKYMSAAPNEKADFKKSATGFIVGAVVLFAATNILTMIADFATKAIK